MSSLADYKRKKAELEESIAEKIREFNLATGEELEACSIEYLRPGPGMTQQGYWLHENGGCLKVRLRARNL